jgi:hypothetical protein
MVVPEGVNPDKLLYRDPFYRGWPENREGTAKTYLASERYVFEIGPFDGIYYTTNAVDEKDYYAQIEVIPDSCPEGGGYGLLFHYEGTGDHYIFTIFCDGRFTVMNRSAGSLASQALAAGDLPAGLDAAATTTHIVAVMAKGTAYSVYLDNEELAAFVDSSHPQGDVGIYAVSQHNAVLRVAFYNLEVWTVR